MKPSELTEMTLTGRVSRWASPLVMNLVFHAVLRLTSPAGATGNEFWADGIQHFYEVIATLPAAYLVDYCLRILIRKRLGKPRTLKSLFQEYGLLLLGLWLFCEMLILVVHAMLGIPNRLYQFVHNPVVFTVVTMLYYMLLRDNTMQRRYARQQVRLAQIEARQFETELEVLRAQYHPHFLFNALNTVYFQIEEKDSGARETVELLSDLLRYRLYDIRQPVMLQEEVEFTEKYMRFQQLRTSGRLKLEYRKEIENGRIMLHPLLFQPLLENAFKYVGGEDYRIEVSVASDVFGVTFSVRNSVQSAPTIDLAARSDSSVSLSGAGRHAQGIGIENLRKRLEILYPGGYRLRTAPDGGDFLAVLTLTQC